MPSTFQTSVLVAALASISNAQLYLSLETGEFAFDRKPHHEEHFHLDHVVQPVLDHSHDVEDPHIL